MTTLYDECDLCGAHSRLVDGVCDWCRDKYSTVEPISQPAPDVPMVTAEDA